MVPKTLNYLIPKRLKFLDQKGLAESDPDIVYDQKSIGKIMDGERGHGYDRCGVFL